MKNKPDCYKYWGKADNEGNYHLLVYHCFDVAAVGKVWLEQSPAFVKRAYRASGLSKTAFTEWFLFFLALHDIGKFDIRFQNLRPDLLKKLQGKQSELPYFPRHDQMGYDFWNNDLLNYIYDVYFKENKIGIVREFLDLFAVISFGHHGLPPESDTVRKTPDAVYMFLDILCRIFLSDRTIHETTSLFFLERLERKELIHKFKHYTWQFAGLVSLCDWIASGDDAFVFKSEEQALKLYFEETCKRAVQAVKRAEIIPAEVSRIQGLKLLFPEFEDTPTPLQKYCNETGITGGAQLWILEDVTGAGKTEAALTLASRILGAGNGTGCFIALPTMATSNAMYERMLKVYSALYEVGSHPSLTLSHGSRHLSDSFRSSFESIPHAGSLFDEETDEGRAHCSQWLADSSKKALLADVGVGTVDQILMAGLPVRYQSLRAFGMSQKVLIIDEVHAFDAYMLRLLENIITAQAAFDSSVILLSATIPFSVREKFCNAFSAGLGIDIGSPKNKTAFPLVTSVTVQHGLTEQAVETRKSVAREVVADFCESVDEVYRLIEKSVSDGKCVCWIRNTIEDVSVSYKELQQRGVKNLDMFHSRFALRDRLSIEKRVLSRFGKDSSLKDRERQVLIASQVVEQSLDLDFDVMISDLAPVDLLIQRAGRLHRHERGDRGKPVFYVHIPEDTETPTAEWYAKEFPKAKWVYRDVALLWRTKEILKQQKRIKMPEEARLLVESVYGESDIIKPQSVFDNSENESWGKMMADKSQAEFNKLNFDQGYCRLSSNRWDEEERIPTRLSDETNTLYLCRWNGENVVPCYNEGRYSWDISSLSLRKSVLDSLEYNIEIENEIDILKKQKRFKYDTLFLVFPEDNKELTGHDGNGKEVVISYSSKRGLIVEKSEKKV